ncbi:serine/threonine-protein kinase-like protein [Dorcoceras hygrometricum]|uniref:Serine/threonine-protein kinase-like protein n=1 Tax=Dorcoceras hygrometricum TaxID=472368 RepID=A0A2Z7CWY6_9LAMI|nr:serine/threonine-protein kinase-like protein [Dorcoceras hygrometricum]
MLNKKLTTENVTVKKATSCRRISSDITISRKLKAISSCEEAQERSDVVQEELSSRKLLFTSSWYLELAIAKRCRSNKLERQRFAFALSFSRWSCDDRTSRYNSQNKPAGSLYIQTQAKVHPVVSYNEPAVAMHPVAR